MSQAISLREFFGQGHWNTANICDVDNVRLTLWKSEEYYNH